MTNDRQARSARAEQMRQEREQADRRRRTIITSAIIAVVVVLVAAGGWGIKKASEKSSDQADVVEPRSLTEGGFEHPSSSNAVDDAPVVEVYEDFLCSHCGDFEAADGAYLSGLAESGDITLRFRPMTILDGANETGPAHDAMNAAVCAADEQGAEAFWSMKTKLFAARLYAGDDEPSADALSRLAEQAGVTGLDSCIESGRFVPWLNEVREVANDRGVTGTPSVFVDGKKLKDPATVRSAVEAALAS